MICGFEAIIAMDMDMPLPSVEVHPPTETKLGIGLPRENNFYTAYCITAEACYRLDAWILHKVKAKPGSGPRPGMTIRSILN
jgi:hypothetical protein